MLHAKIIDIEKNKIKTSDAEAFIKSSSYGASIIFNGTVRNVNENKEVIGITYDSHDELVLKCF
jgi:molybdopterin synthase catalytic subunit